MASALLLRNAAVMIQKRFFHLLSCQFSANPAVGKSFRVPGHRHTFHSIDGAGRFICRKTFLFSRTHHSIPLLKSM